jgi:hypothetical protein
MAVVRIGCQLHPTNLVRTRPRRQPGYRDNAGRGAEIAWLVLIAAQSENGQTTEARADLEKFLATPRTYRSVAEVQKLPVEWAANSKLLAGLRLAGMPEE